MIDGLFKRHIDPLWEKAAAPLVQARLTPNQVTAAGLVLIAVASAAYLAHKSSLVFGLTLAIAFAFDALDGAVARQRDMRSKVGGYFDAMVDRYQELAVLAAIAFVANLWPAAFFAFAGGVLTSYAKARTAVEIPIDNDAWPDLFERLERIIFLCVLLVVDGAASTAGFGTPWILGAGLTLYAVLANVSALQRIARATVMLRRSDAGQDHGEGS
ncbi:CDP-alcohol phosphatidyltransferase family protein [Rhizobiales bacterium]|uniref:CDP-alcohol phosphatidyltransferase family protein n=1 Tax=Hongsoonwoonella zoysiae TaxID=2821844 RepID=UPI00155F55BD|nr:CDP-alcohol phosphatidyltransferase family protein [Hongsoonwoonella zoysiae]NRG16646.1 CDP-alcohol phosphatidyltransferase family protein [Hongsoonwoonella zoysiae]